MSTKEHPIIFSTEMVKAILDGRKTQTRRIVKIPKYGRLKSGYTCEDGIHANNRGYVRICYDLSGCADFRTQYCPYGQVGDRLYCRENYYILDEYLLRESDILYRLTDDRIHATLTMEVQDGRYKTDEWSPSQSYPNLPQRGLHGGLGWSNLLTNKIQGLWAEGIRGLVSASRSYDGEISSDNNEPRESESYQECSPPDMYGFSWDAPVPVVSDQAFRWEWTKQLAKQFAVGNARRKLDGQEGTRKGDRGRETPNGEAIKLPDDGSQVGNRDRASESAQSSENTWDVAGWHLRSCPSAVLRLKPSIHMPRWASRITLEITEVRVERVQEITEVDAKAEGSDWYSIEYKQQGIGRCKQAFHKLWDSINAKRGYGWEVNPWVWVISFKVIT